MIWAWGQTNNIIQYIHSIQILHNQEFSSIKNFRSIFEIGTPTISSKDSKFHIRFSVKSSNYSQLISLIVTGSSILSVETRHYKSKLDAGDDSIMTYNPVLHESAGERKSLLGAARSLFWILLLAFDVYHKRSGLRKPDYY